MADVNSQIKDVPAKLSNGWSGYLHYKEKTMIPSNVLTFPSRNCFMPVNDKIINRDGSLVLGQEATDTFPIIGHYKKFNTILGMEMEIRVLADTGSTNAIFQFLYTDSSTNDQSWVTFIPFLDLTLFPNILGGRHVYFDEWWDNTFFKTRLVWAAGTPMSWSGGYGIIGTVAANTITLANGMTWVSQGFDGNEITVEGSSYAVVSGNDTTTITVTDATGITPGAFVTDSIVINPHPGQIGPVHYASTLKNHVIYGNFYTHQMYGSNAFNFPSISAITRSSAVLDDLIITNGGSYTGNTQVVLRLQITATGSPDTLFQYVNGVFFGTISANVGWTYAGVTLQTSASTGHTSGDFWDVTLTPAVTNGWGDFYQTAPVRKPGEAFSFFIPSNFWTMSVQENTMYVNDTRGNWTYLQLTLSADLLTETVTVEPLKQNAISKVIYPYMIGYMENDIMFVTDQKNLDSISRIRLVQLPQVEYLSDRIKLDFQASSFIGGGMEFWDKKLWITSPEEGWMHCLDSVRNYWQPPQFFPEAGILSLVGSSLIAHSNVQNQTNTLFTGSSDNGEKYNLRIRTGYLSFGNRWSSKLNNMSFIEGYMKGNPTITMTTIGFPVKDNNFITHIVDPVIETVPAVDYVGGNSVGSVPIGGGFIEDAPMFHEIWKARSINWYFMAYDLDVTLKDQLLVILSLGVNAIWSNTGNNDYSKGEDLLGKI